MEKSNVKLLLNAEPFGFGPTAAIATFFPYIREQCTYLGYIGKNHTLDLQAGLPYEAIHDVPAASNEEIQQITSQYDVFVTALDFEMAAIAKSTGKKVVIYDPLTWYWKSVPVIVAESDLYLAQDFFGVAERLRNETHLFPRNTKTVAPIVSQRRPRASKQHILINLGGLQNPFWSVDDVFHYAHIVIEAIKECVPKDEVLVVATSNAVAMKLNDPRIRSYSRAGMYDILENTKCAFMTPGLGNIYDAAKFDIPTIWLPPANDSQGQQLELLREHGMSDGQIDWLDLGRSIDYFANQTQVLKNIKEAIHTTRDARVLCDIVRKTYQDLISKQSSATTALLDQFGTGGAKEVGTLLFEYCQSIE